jgi:hypothetical protein
MNLTFWKLWAKKVRDYFGSPRLLFEFRVILAFFFTKLKKKSNNNKKKKQKKVLNITRALISELK